MAEDQGRGLPSGLLAALLLIAGALLVNQLPLNVLRPPTGEKVRPSPISVQDVEARLWQDPFAPVDKYLEDLRKEPDSASRQPHARPAIAPWVRATTPVTVLAVPVFGGGYPEYAEQRRRIRYAIVSALFASGLGPHDAEHVGYYVLAQTDRAVPYEWFRAEDHGVLVVWPDENAFSDDPLSRLDTTLAPVRTALQQHGVQHVQLKILGPASSDTLKGMVGAAALPPELRDIELMSYSATARLASTQGPPGLRLRRTIATDDQIVDALRAELALRHVVVGADDVAVVSERDTSYAREFRRTLVCGRASCDEDDMRRRAAAQRVHLFSYLRGVDGVTSARTTTSASEGADAKKDDAPASRRERFPGTAAAELADGNAQFDYVRRIAEEVRRLERDVARRGRNVRAVLVVGTDVYDKLAVLQALRDALPAAVFATTDLDSRLLHRSELAFTRNLVVASAFGLTLAPALQRDTPPFRDSYQTSAYYATLLALGAAGTRGPGGAQLVPTQPAVRVFEIGRHGAVDLSPGSRYVECRRPTACFEAHPRSDATFFDVIGIAELPWTTVGSTVLALALLAALLYAANFKARSYASRAWSTAAGVWARHRTAAVAAAGTSLAIVSAMAVLVILDGDTGEPFSLTAGISIWPSEAIRFLAAALAIVFLFHTRAIVRGIRERIAMEFFLPVAEGLPKPPRTWGELGTTPHRRWLLPRIFTGRVSNLGEDRRRPVAHVLWRRYVFQGTSAARAIRVGTMSVLFFMLAGCVFAIAGRPEVPGRGVSAWHVDAIAVLVDVVLFVILTFVIVDEIRLCNRFTLALSDRNLTRWPEEAIASFGRRRAAQARFIACWIDVCFIARWTEAIGRLVFYPFILLLLIVVARSSFFDRWSIPPALLVVVLLNFALATLAPLMLRRAAERTRKTALEILEKRRMRAERYAAVTAPEPGAPPTPVVRADGAVDQAESDRVRDAYERRCRRRARYEAAVVARAQLVELIADIRALNRGAFARWRDQPVVQAVAIPLSGASGLTLLEYLFSIW